MTSQNLSCFDFFEIDITSQADHTVFSHVRGREDFTHPDLGLLVSVTNQIQGILESRYASAVEETKLLDKAKKLIA